VTAASRHAVIGAGGIGGLIAAALARGGADVLVLMREASLRDYPGRIVVESAALGDFEAAVPAAPVLERAVDVVWMATKATDLERALALAPAEVVADAAVIPLLNGIDHVDVLRARYANVLPGAIRVESERVAPGRIRQTSPFLLVELTGPQVTADALRAGGVSCEIRADERSLLWSKLVFLAPLALATTAFDQPLGEVREDDRYRGAQSEALAVAAAEGAVIDADAVRAASAAAPAGMRSSMQKDVAAGHAPELDAIAGPILRGGRLHNIPTPNTSALARLVAQRVAER
jgi:2-dehydropantoate 2-reductase